MSAPRPTGGRLALIHGYSLPEGAEAVEGERVTIDAGGTEVDASDGGHVVAIARHGRDRSVPAHRVDHHANIRAVCELGCDRVLAIGSAGSLRTDWPVGTLVCPDDFFAPGVAPSFYDDVRGHSIPGFDPGWRRRVIGAWGSLAPTPLLDGGVYAQTLGPRFETPAEVRALARVADLVGMTLASEAILAREAGLLYAAVCTIDNLANGLGERPLTIEEFRRNRDRIGVALLEAIALALPGLSEVAPGR